MPLTYLSFIGFLILLVLLTLILLVLFILLVLIVHDDCSFVIPIKRFLRWYSLSIGL